MKFSYSYQIQPQDVDYTRRLRLYTLENYILNVAGKAAEEQGYGLSQLLPLGYTWVITRLNLELNYMPTHYETIRVETWVEQNAHMLSVRNYRIYIDTQLIGQAKSVWAVLDIHKREIVNAFDLPMFQDKVDGEVLTMNKPARLMPVSEPDGQVPYTIQYSDCDYNQHCNSCKYLERMMDAHLCNVENFPIRLDINYIKEVHNSEQIVTKFFTDSQGTHYQQVDQNNKSVCTALISHLEKVDF
ncbi:MAG: thioesterase [Paludibacteraceae bacterium]|nr:thioesterase [Paludibacteraceae bacterium]